MNMKTLRRAAFTSLSRFAHQPSISLSLRSAPLIPRRQVCDLTRAFGYTQVKALVFSQHGEPSTVLRLHAHSISPQLSAETVLTRTLAAPINPADINMIQGTYGSNVAFSSVLGTSQPSAIPGNEGVFEIVATSSPHFQEGDWVLPSVPQFGTWRTHAIAKRDELMKIDRRGLTPIQAATVSVNPCTAYRILRSYGPSTSIKTGLRMQPLQVGSGAIFIQNGANSGVGRAAIQFGKVWGLKSINIIRERGSPGETEELVQDLKSLGADHVVTEAQLFSKRWVDLLAHLTHNGRDKIELGLNCIGGRSATALARSLSKGATLVSYGAMSRQPLSLPVGLLIFKHIHAVGFWLSQWNKEDPIGREHMINDILELIRTKQFHDVPVQEFKWASDTDILSLQNVVQKGLQGFKNSKDVFVF